MTSCGILGSYSVSLCPQVPSQKVRIVVALTLGLLGGLSLNASCYQTWILVYSAQRFAPLRTLLDIHE